MRILIVEDDREFAGILRRSLTEQLHSVVMTHDGESGRHRALTEDFDLILLDLMLPKLDGVAVCHAIRAAGRPARVVMLTARDDVDDRILGLDAGADDYIVKPFAMRELLARIRAVARRDGKRAATLLRVGPLTLDPRSSYVQIGSRRVELTAREFGLLEFLMRHPDQVLTRAEIFEGVWDSSYESLGNVVDVYVNYLRNKLNAGGARDLLQTARGRGYVLRASAEDGIG